MRWWPRTVRWQLLASLILLEALSVLLFAGILISKLGNDIHEHSLQQLVHQASSLSLQAGQALRQDQGGWVGVSVRTTGDATSVSSAKVTDPDGNVLYASKGDPAKMRLEPAESAQIPLLKSDQLKVFSLGHNRWESAAPVYAGGELRGYAWVENNRAWDMEQLRIVEKSILIFGVIWNLASILLILLLSRLISKPLQILHRGTAALITLPVSTSHFPLPVTVDNEFGELIEAFNRMVASLEEQRAGLNDTLSLLDSMLANAPIGLAFFDRRFRCVRVNQVFAQLTSVSLNRHLGRTLPELLPQPVAEQLEGAVERVFAVGQPENGIEVAGQGGKPLRPWTWLVSAYPVRTNPDEVRWAGVIVQDVSERKRKDEALRKTEKLAATGRLAASIAHEINNPLEAITNLLFLLRNFSGIQEPALNYVTMAEHEARRIAEIAQQTLRFYRQSTLPLRTPMSELIDSVLNLYQGRLNTLDIQVERDYDPEMTLFCFSGEIRQVFANLVGNAVDATPGGGRLRVRARRSRSWQQPQVDGVRFTVGDTGCGMDREVRERVFEAFFTTKDVTGTGLGLWVSHEIILKHKGKVHVRSTPDGLGKPSGTVFQMFIPDDETLTYAIAATASLARESA
jgi:PAS domain S-box-containing protein